MVGFLWGAFLLCVYKQNYIFKMVVWPLSGVLVPLPDYATLVPHPTPDWVVGGPRLKCQDSTVEWLKPRLQLRNVCWPLTIFCLADGWEHFPKSPTLKQPHWSFLMFGDKSIQYFKTRVKCFTKILHSAGANMICRKMTEQSINHPLIVHCHSSDGCCVWELGQDFASLI